MKLKIGDKVKVTKSLVNSKRFIGKVGVIGLMNRDKYLVSGLRKGLPLLFYKSELSPLPKVKKEKFWCVKCTRKRAGKNILSVPMKTGDKAEKASCEVCGTAMFRISKHYPRHLPTPTRRKGKVEKIIQIASFGEKVLIALTNRGSLYATNPHNFKKWIKKELPDDTKEKE